MGPAGTLLSVNVGMPKDVSWQGRTVFTGVFKDPVDRPAPGAQAQRRRRRPGRPRRARRRAARRVRLPARLVPVLGARARAETTSSTGSSARTSPSRGSATTRSASATATGSAPPSSRSPSRASPVTASGIRMNDPRIPALLVSHHRPGFYLRVLQEGEVQAGDEIVKLASGPEQMTVAEVDALLYLPGHPRQQLLRALRIPALSPGWQASFRALLEGGPGGGNAGLATASPPPAWPGFRRLTVAGIDAGERLRDLHPPRRPGGRPAPRRASRPVPHAAGPARGRAEVVAPQLLPLGTARRRLLPDRRQARAATASPAATCTPASASGPSSRSPRPGAPSSSTRTTRRCC